MTLQIERTTPTLPLASKHTNGIRDTSTLLQRPSTSLWQFLQISSTSTGGVLVYQPGSTCEKQNITNLSYESLLEQSEDKARRLRAALPNATGDTIILLHFDNHTQSIGWLWAIIRAGYIPAISTPLSAHEHQRNSHIQHLKDLLNDPVFLTSDSMLRQYPETQALSFQTADSLVHVQSSSDLPQLVSSDDHEKPAVLMLTSGSTGNAKAVVLTINQIVTSVCGKSEAWATTGSSVFLNWIGLDHVANLTEMHLQAMLVGAQQVHIQANDLLADPLLFIHTLSRHRVTHTFAPNFFLAILEKKLLNSAPTDPVWSLDLSALKSIMSGGEANVVSTAETMGRLLNRLRAPGQVIRTGYGLTESCAALMYGMLDISYEEREKHEFASIGKPITGANVRVTLDDGSLATLYETGNLELAGPVIFSRYFNNPSATQKAFTKDGWYMTGDRAYIDSSNKVNMAGRAKEVIVINGVKYFPVDIEAAIEKASLRGILPSYIATFAHRPPGSSTETYCIVYGSKPSVDSPLRTVDTISHITSRVVGTRPEWVIPLPQARLDKSSLGKLPRSKIQAQFDAGVFGKEKVNVAFAVRQLALQNRVAPESRTEFAIVKVLASILQVADDEISVDRTIFEVGITSAGLFRFEQSLRKELRFGTGISIITFLSNPMIRNIATAIENQHSRTYDPVVQLQAHGTKTPLWLVHPASGNVLAFLPLARIVTDRPLYALTARGLSNNETLFSSISEMSDVYFSHVKKLQPSGPYALTGYSLGTTVAFELAKRLEANGDNVAFCAALDSPPHVIPLVQDLDWAAAAVLVSYFLELIPQDSIPELIERFRGMPKPELVQSVLNVSRPAQRALLNLDREQLLAIVNVTDNFGAMAKTYHPKGSVEKVDIFYCTPLHSVERGGREKWIADFLSRWQDFSRERVAYHECEGDHADMLNPAYVEGFEKRLAMVLQMRGL